MSKLCQKHSRARTLPLKIVEFHRLTTSLVDWKIAISILLKNGPLFSFLSFQYSSLIQLIVNKLADDWTRTANLWFLSDCLLFSLTLPWKVFTYLEGWFCRKDTLMDFGRTQCLRLTMTTSKRFQVWEIDQPEKRIFYELKMFLTIVTL